jgi:neutral ceramidase
MALAVVLVVLAFASLDAVDLRPYLRQPYYTETAGRLRASLATNRLEQGDMQAGFGRALLTPSVNAAEDDPVHGRFRSLPLAGYGARHGKPATGTHDDLYVKAVAIRVGARTGVLVSADALIIPNEVADAAMSRLGEEFHLAREQVYLSATHAHSSLGGWGEGFVAEEFAGEFQPGSRVWMADRIVTAASNALADLKPASFGHGSFMAPEFVRNRLVGQLGKVDPEFSFAVLKQKEGKLGVLGSYAAHATVLPSSMMEFSADYPGCWQRAVEAATGGTAVFLAGGVGSHSPVPGGKGFDGVDRMGQSLAKALLAQLPKTALTNRVTLGLQSLDLSLPPLNVRVTDGIRLRPWLAQRLLRAPTQCVIQVFRLNQSLWISTPCDFSGELALRIKEAMRVREFQATATSFNGGYVGYVIPARYYHLDGYEPRLMSFFGCNTADYFEEMIQSMAASLTRQ